MPIVLKAGSLNPLETSGSIEDCTGFGFYFCSNTAFVLVLASFYLLLVGVERYCCTTSHTMTHTHAHTVGRTALDEGSARLKNPLPDNTKLLQGTDNHAPGGIRIRNPSKRAATDPRLRGRSHRYRQLFLSKICPGNMIRHIFFLFATSPYFYSQRAGNNLDRHLDNL